MNGSVNLLDRYRAVFSDQIKQNVQEAAWVRDWRESAFAEFLNEGLPGPKTEQWKYTHIQTALADAEFIIPQANPEIPTVENYRLAANNEYFLVFVNGYFSAPLSDTIDPNTIKVHRLAELGEDHTLRQYLDQSPQAIPSPFSAINSSFWQDGFLIEITEGNVIEKPIHILYITDNSSTKFSTYPRCLVVAGANSKATIIEHYAGLSDETVRFTNALTEVFVEKNAELNYYRLNREPEQTIHVGGIHVQQQSHSHFNYFSYGESGKVTRNNVNVDFAGPNAHCDVNGIYLCAGKQLLDNHISIEHSVPQCSSDCLFKGIAKDQSRAVFNGRVHIHADAQETKAKLYNRNLLLSNRAEIDTKPELEIYADNVQAAHGATVSQLDHQHLYYLQTRGLSKTDAEALLNFAFINDPVAAIENEPIRDFISQWIVQYFKDSESLRRILE